MCGIIGIYSQENKSVSHEIYDGLIILQHRGQDAAGIATCHEGKINIRKRNGYVRSVFQQDDINKLKGNFGIGHVRYPTAGNVSVEESQPFFVNAPYGIALAHNGNLVNATKLKVQLINEDHRHVNTQSDSEVLINILAHELLAEGNHQLTQEHVVRAIKRLHTRCSGGYAVVALIVGFGLIGFRDPHGIRPLIVGRRNTDYCIASESAVLDVLGFDLVKDVGPGQCIIVNNKGEINSYECANNRQLTPCIFEYVYFARPDSVLDNINVHKARLRMGDALATKILKQFGNEHNIDVVIPIPDSSRTSAVPLAYQLGVKYREGFVKNRYIGRTFIMPNNQTRRQSIRQKLNVIPIEFKQKNVLLVDDSIVRGNTATEIVQMARDAGAASVLFASAAPRVRYQNVYGIDMPCVSELIAHEKTEDQVREAIRADRLIYQDLDDLTQAVRAGNCDITNFDGSCFNGEYVTGDVTREYLQSIERVRRDELRM